MKRFYRVVMLMMLAALLVPSQPAAAAPLLPLSGQDFAFNLAWSRTDQLVAGGTVKRSWYWGPAPFARMGENFGGKARATEYYDKGRMEINDFSAPRSSASFVTNGRLTMELVSGLVQVGPTTYETRPASPLAIVGDGAGNPSPSYASLANVISVQPGGKGQKAANRTGQAADGTLDVAGKAGSNPTLAGRYAAASKMATFVPQTSHNVPTAFWQFLNQSGPILSGPGNRELQSGAIIDWVATMGYPVGEAYWVRTNISGKAADIMIQPFERRMLSYNPANPAGYQVEMTNVGQHYYDWRFAAAGNSFRVPVVSRAVRIVIPTVRVDTTIKETYVQNGAWQVAEFAAGHLFSSSYPGDPGNSVYAGHNNFKGEVFRYLSEIKVGAEITVYMGDGKQKKYRVTENTKVPETGQSMQVRLQNAKYTNQTPDERLTLITCWPYTTYTHRIIVIAKPTN